MKEIFIVMGLIEGELCDALEAFINKENADKRLAEIELKKPYEYRYYDFFEITTLDILDDENETQN
jgi:hypothetical protein